MEIKFLEKKIGDRHPVFIIAEIGLNHNGSINIAKKLIDVAVEAGCDAVKFQKRAIDKVYTKEELDAPRPSPWGTTNRAQKEWLEFSIEEYILLEKYTKEKGLDFIVSCWDIDSLKLIEKNFEEIAERLDIVVQEKKDFDKNSKV